ncbi:SDR family oxidoreductase [Xanthovirga aplysinae]|uniref:SDR family oxidoreductase n=1 Tax=Xanthovirga aplysinae TaxID=2529853 RepID=UPI0012BC5B20|nr:SDR family oxidoreductase [Xanthovirga aplysinae]MTI30172.1 SDR family oxidoreductase [Xanthovirga aplysinae]
MELGLKGKRALVCGSTQGIGKAVAEELALLGAHITLIARSEDKLKEVLSNLSRSEEQMHDYICADFSQPQQLKLALEKNMAQNPQVEILINNTGGPAGGPAIDADIEAFTDAFSKHLICNQILTQAVVPSMKSAGYGRIINIISTSVKQPIKGLGVSNTIRGAVANWSKTLSVELGPFGITVNNVLPGTTRTARLDVILENKAKKENKSLEQVEKDMKAEVPAGRFGIATEIAAAAAFLATPAAAYINGINLPVDGGRTSSL